MNIYLDNNATTRLDPLVLEAMMPYLREDFGNPSSIHAHGQRARRALDDARAQVAAFIGATPEEIVFTSGGTEADNHALFGAMQTAKAKGKGLVLSSVEHQAVLNTAHALQMRGVPVCHLPVDASGIVSGETLLRELEQQPVALVSVMAANNDVGTLQPIAELASLTIDRGIVFHTDAVQAAGKIPFDVSTLPVSMASLSSHKIHGPKGAGALYIRSGTRVAPLIHGGHHESRRRAGTENVPAIVGFGVACALAAGRLAQDAERLAQLRDRLQEQVTSRIQGITVHGDRAPRLPGTLNFSVRGIEGETLLMALDLAGVSASTGSACSSDDSTPSHVLTAMGVDPVLSRSSLRLSLGRENTQEEIDQTARSLEEIVGRLRGLDRA